MINPEQRSLLTDALTPPDLYRFDCGVATTYSLDLITLLTLPLHLARRDAEHTSPDRPDALPLLDALRRMGNRLTVFCQRGRMQTPRSSNALLGLLESMVQETHAPHEHGVFHPKVWLMRFVSADVADRNPVLLRLLVLTRNLTDDRSWDLSLWLEGEPGKKRVEESWPLAMFIEWLQRGKQEALGAARTEQIELLCADAAHTTWQLPDKFTQVRFHPLGIDRKMTSWYPETANGSCWDELGVISPFVSTNALTQLASSAHAPLFLIARAEELDKCPSHGGFETVRVLSDLALSSDSEDDDVHRQRGLHAKVYIGRRAGDTHLFIGSANATAAALEQGRNVEFVIELIGRTSKVGGPEKWLGDEGLGPLLSDYVRSAPVEPGALDDERALEVLRDELARAPLALHGEAAGSNWTVRIHGLDGIGWNGASAQSWLVSQNETWATQIDAAQRADDSPDAVCLGEFAPHQVTAFTGFTLRRGEATLSFVLKLPLCGGPEERDLEILHAAIRNRQGLIRYLLLLLGDWDTVESDGNSDGVKVREANGASFDDMPLFEMLARAYAREPERLAQVRDLVERLRRRPAREEVAGDASEQTDEPIITADFLEVWSVFEEALNNEKNK